jgi:hypothetical protein
VGALVNAGVFLLIAGSSGLLVVLLAISLLNVFSAQRLEAAPPPMHTPLVSVLIPARNEAENLTSHLPALLSLDYPRLEILVLDDGSEDGTRALVERAAAHSGGRLRALSGSDPPPGWLGKNWACHQLASVARGDIMVFCDADVSPRADAVTLTVGTLHGRDADVLSAFPRQRFGGVLQAAVIPLVAQLPVLTLLPLRLAERHPEPSLSVANGQWIAFTRAAYAAAGGHAAVQGEVVEDVELGRKVKTAGLRLVPVVASSALSVRMYGDARALREGFRKNLYPLIGGRPATLLLALVVFALTAVVPLVAPLLAGSVGLLPLALLALVRACGVMLFRHGWRSVLLHPLGAVLVSTLALDSFFASRGAGVVWKGRQLAARRVGASMPGAGVRP